MRHLSLCTGEQPLVPHSCGFIFSRTNLTTRNAIELATRASFLTILRVVCCLRRLILYRYRLLHENCCMNTITHCTVSQAFLFRWHLGWGKEETQIGKVKEERKTPLFKVLSYLDNTAQASLLLTPDRCYINPKKRNYSITLLPRLRDSQILRYYL